MSFPSIMSKKGIKTEDLSESLQDERIATFLCGLMEKSLSATLDKLVKTLTSKIENDIMAKTEAAIRANSCDLTNKTKTNGCDWIICDFYVQHLSSSAGLRAHLLTSSNHA